MYIVATCARSKSPATRLHKIHVEDKIGKRLPPAARTRPPRLPQPKSIADCGCSKVGAKLQQGSERVGGRGGGSAQVHSTGTLVE